MTVFDDATNAINRSARVDNQPISDHALIHVSTSLLAIAEAINGLTVAVAALAEPERDEEGDMLGGDPRIKHHDATVPADGEQPGPKPRLRACVEAWPACEEGEYNPACCRFPKSCSCDVYDPARVGPDDLEGSR